MLASLLFVCKEMSWNFVLAKPIWLSKCCPTGRVGRFSASASTRVEATLRMQGLAPLDLKSASVPILCCAIEHRTCDATMDFPTLLSVNVYGARLWNRKDGSGEGSGKLACGSESGIARRAVGAIVPTRKL